jgi:hypothetical protein
VALPPVDLSCLDKTGSTASLLFRRNQPSARFYRITPATNASFAGNADMSLLMDGVIALRNCTDNLLLLHWFFNKSLRVASSILAATDIAFVTIYDIATSFKEVRQQILAKRVDMYLFADCYSLLSNITKNQYLREKMMLLAILRQAYRHHDEDDVGIRSVYNLSDFVTKDFRGSALLDLLHTGKLSRSVEEYIKRDKFGAKDEKPNAGIDNYIFFCIV